MGDEEASPWLWGFGPWEWAADLKQRDAWQRDAWASKLPDGTGNRTKVQSSFCKMEVKVNRSNINDGVNVSGFSTND